MYSEFGPQGLAVLAISHETLDLVEPYVDENDLPFPVIAGSTSREAYGVEGFPQTFLIDADGKVVWEGHPGDLSKAAIKKALKGAKRPKGDFLSVRIDGDEEARTSKARSLAQDGDLGGAVKEIDAILADPKSTDAQKQAAASDREQIDAHLKMLASQAEGFVKTRDVEKAVLVLEAIKKALPSADSATAAAKRLAQIAADEKLMKEVDAGKALLRLKDQIRPLKKDKAKPKIEDFIKKYEGTRAAERAAILLKKSKG